MQNGGQRNRQGGDVGQRIEICRACAVAHPQPFLSRRLKAGVVSFTLCTQGIVWGDRIFEKCGIGRDEGGDGGKTLEIRGKRRLPARDGGANYQQS